MSRGGLIALNWAIDNPDRVSAVYVDAPVCDIRSWPGGRARAREARSTGGLAWRQVDRRESATAKVSPIDRPEPLARPGCRS